MMTVALRGLAQRKLRAALTALAIVLGVAMITGTYILTDTIRAGFDTLFENAYAKTDAVVTGKGAFDSDFAAAPPFSADLLSRVQRVPGVASAAGSIDDQAQLTDPSGKAIDTKGAPALALGMDASGRRLSPLEVVSGAWPSGPGQVMIDAGTADDEGLAPGDRIGVVAQGPEREYTVSGVARFAGVDSIGSATLAVFDLPTAQRIFGKEGRLDAIRVAADPGVSAGELTSRIGRVLPARTVVRTGEQQAVEDGKDTQQIADFVEYFLLTFAGVALFVGAFVIFNTISITVAQRTREFATLRTLGASRRQVLGAVVVEALVVGVLASLAGLGAGFGIAEGLQAAFRAGGVDLPSAGTVFATRTVVVSLVAGVAVTLLSGLVPAIRATRVPPIAAVREGAQLPASRVSRLAPAIAAATTLLAVVLIGYGAFTSGLAVRDRLVTLIGGVVILFIGVALLSARLVRPLAAVVGWPARRMGGAAGRLAQRNATRNPARTANTAAALMVGLALITFVAVLAQGLRASVGDAVQDQVSADYVVTSDDGFTPFVPAADAAVRTVPGAVATPVRGDYGKVFGSKEQVTGVDPATIAGSYRFDWVAGSDSTARDLGPHDALVEKSFADDHHLAPGSRIRMTAPSGDRLDLTVRGVFDSPPLWQMLGAVVMPARTFDGAFESPKNLYTFVHAPGGVTGPETARLTTALDGFPSLVVGTRAEFVEDQQAGIDPVLNLLYVLLALSVVVSLFGIVNTLVLAVLERTRELGMLRAVGMTRRQMRRMVRHESVITALIGGVLGIVLGLGLSALVTRALADEGLVFEVPGGSLVVFVVIAVVAGIVAAILPARRAARLDPLRALQYE